LTNAVTPLIGFGTNEGWVAPVTMSLPFVIAFLGVCLMGFLVLRGDYFNRINESEMSGIGDVEQPETVPMGTTATPALETPAATEEPVTRNAPTRRRRAIKPEDV
jgi:hypothetical protein